MVTFTQILCPTDLSDAAVPALAHAASLARWYEATLTVLHVVPTFDAIHVVHGRVGASREIVQPPTREDVVLEMERVIPDALLAGVKARLVVEAGDAPAVILDQSLAIPADLLVMGTHGRSGFDRLVFGSVTEKVMRKAGCPVLTVPPHAPASPAHEDLAYHRVVCAMDFSPASLQALGFALDLARQANGTVTVLHVLEWVAEDDPTSPTALNLQAYRAHLIEQGNQRLREVLDPEPPTWCEIEPLVTTGRIHREVLRVAEQRRADLIVMGVRGRGALGLALFGSTAQQVVRTAHCPVLLAHGVGDGA